MLKPRTITIFNNVCHIIIVLSLTLFTISCSSGGNSSATGSSLTPTVNTNKSSISTSPLDTFYTMNIGSGYDTSSNSVTSDQTCLSGALIESNIYISNPGAIMQFNEEQDFSSLETSLGVNVSGSLAGGMFGTSLSAQYITNSQNTQYTTNIIYLYEYAGVASFKQGSLNYGMNALVPVAQSLVESYPIQFRQMCGNSFIAQMDAGALLGVTLTLGFNSHMDQQLFNAKMAANVGLANVAAAIEEAASGSNVNINFTLSAIQLGGEPQQLNNLFGHAESDGNYPYVDCGNVGSTNMNACNLMISNIITYAQSLESQVSNPDGSLNTNNLYLNNPVIANYDSLGITIGAPDPESAILDAMQTITAEYNKTMYDYTFVSHYLLALSGELDSPTQENLEDAQSKLSSQLQNVYLNPVYQILNCYQGYVSPNCLQIEANVNNALAAYQLLPQESEEIAYLETSSYSATLYNYTGGAVESAGDYQLSSQPCVLAPISSPISAQYAIECAGTWFPVLSPAGLIITNGGDDTLAVSGLDYSSLHFESGSGIVYSRPINYGNSALTQDPFYNNYFDTTGVSIIGGSTFNESGSLGLTQWFENQA